MTSASTAAKKILIVAPSWIGDTILAQPLLIRLHEQGASIDVLAPAWSAPLLQRMPQIDRVIESPFSHGDFAFKERLALGKQLVAAHYDAAYVLPNSWKSALVPYFADIPLRAGYHGEARFFLLNRRFRLDKTALPQLAQRYARLADAPGTRGMPRVPAPRLNSNREQQLTARSILELPAEGSPVIFCPGAEYGPAKRWPAHHFADLAQQLGNKDDPVWILGSAADKEVGDNIVRLANVNANGCAINLCGRTSLEQAIDLIATARLVVSNDSGLMHVAAALDRPLLALYGSSSPVYTPPLSAHAKIVSLNVECSPCFQRQCPLGHFKCMEGMTPEHVLVQMRTPH